jgi:hypothetical protein
MDSKKETPQMGFIFASLTNKTSLTTPVFADAGEAGLFK